jgi:hypothetical protein
MRSKLPQVTTVPAYQVVVAYTNIPVLNRIIERYSIMRCGKIYINNNATVSGIITGATDSSSFRKAFDTIPGARVLAMQRVKSF